METENRRESNMTMPDFSYERKVCGNPPGIIIGSDEVGYGAVAGPLTVSASCFIGDFYRNGYSEEMEQVLKGYGIKDSKKFHSSSREMAHDKRLRVARKLKGLAKNGGFLSFIMERDPHELNELVRSGKSLNRILMELHEQCARKLIKRLEADGHQVAAILVDGSATSHGDMPKGLIRNRMASIVRGDAHSLTIAASSIMAKTRRDSWMMKIDTDYRS